MTSATARTYEWGIESSASSEAGCIAGGTGCGHRHSGVQAAVVCQGSAWRRRGRRHLAGEIVTAILPDGTSDRLTEAELDIIVYDLP